MHTPDGELPAAPTLFLALAPATWGEARAGLALAQQRHARTGDVLFVAPSSLSALFYNAQVPYRLFPVGASLPRVLADVHARFQPRQLILVDAMATLLNSQACGCTWSQLIGRAARVAALDLWDLDAAGDSWDLGSVLVPVPQEARALPRVCPAPLGAPDRATSYAALPEAPPVSTSAAPTRSDLGLAAETRVVLFATSTWQDPDLFPPAPGTRAIAFGLRSRVAAWLKAWPNVVLLHAAPAPWGDLAASLGPRYRFVGQLPPARMQRLLAIADVLLSANAASTLLADALVQRLPVLLLQSTAAGCSIEQVAASVSWPLVPQMRDWIATVLPLRPFCVWPVGLSAFLRGVVHGNPLYRGLATVELTDDERVRDTLAELLFGNRLRAQLTQSMAELESRYRALPDGDALLAKALGETPTRSS
ncbi:MAG TPA: DUF6365 family protein [Pseudomonadota bacterium]|nr:DUF6365 family protein [Pseudomonadota bacterium]